MTTLQESNRICTGDYDLERKLSGFKPGDPKRLELIALHMQEQGNVDALKNGQKSIRELKKRNREQQAIDNLVNAHIEIDREAAQEAGALGFMPRMFLQATLPHRDLKRNEFERRNGKYTLSIISQARIGLPYGVYPRLVTAWITAEAVRTKSRDLVLGDSLSDYMRQLSLKPTGGRWGSITQLREQMHRLFSITISCSIENEKYRKGKGFRLADNHVLWWDPKEPREKGLFNSTVRLSEVFFKEITSRPVPIDMRALKALKRSSLSLDLYGWLTYRNSYLYRPTQIPWEVLRLQFGAEHADTRQGRHKFKCALEKALAKVLVVYPANVSSSKSALVLKPSKTHVRQSRALISN